jgi:hypothetical protein
MPEAYMQTASKAVYTNRVVPFPEKGITRTLKFSDARTQFERLLIFVLCTLWAVGIVLWTLLSVVGMGHGSAASGIALDSVALPTSLPTLQSATIFAVKLMLGL